MRRYRKENKFSNFVRHLVRYFKETWRRQLEALILLAITFLGGLLCGGEITLFVMVLILVAPALMIDKESWEETK